jgi:hypothetical protein
MSRYATLEPILREPGDVTHDSLHEDDPIPPFFHTGAVP